MTNCTNHCRPCNAHFTSLAAFDLHRQNGECSFKGTKKKLKQTKGTCKVSDPDNPQHKVNVYELASTDDYRKFRIANT